MSRRGTTLLEGVRLPTDERILPLVRQLPFGRSTGTNERPIAGANRTDVPELSHMIAEFFSIVRSRASSASSSTASHLTRSSLIPRITYYSHSLRIQI